MKPNNRAVILLGSNIHPAENLTKAIELLSGYSQIINRSLVWETEAVGSNGPNFLNQAIEIETSFSAEDIKNSVIKEIETRLGRQRTDDKYAPRTIDLDIILLNETVYDHALWEKAFIAVPVSEIKPGLRNPANQRTLEQTAEILKSSTFIKHFQNNQ